MKKIMKIKLVFLTSMACLFLASILMESAIYASDLEEGETMKESEARDLVKTSYKGLGADIQKIFESNLMSCAVCVKKKPENYDEPTVIHFPVRLLFDYKESSIHIDAAVDINTIKQEKFNPKFYNIKKMVLYRLHTCVSFYLLEVVKEVMQTSPDLADQLLKRKIIITIHKNKEEYWREALICNTRNRCFETPDAVVKVDGYDEAVLIDRSGRKLGFWNIGPLKDLEGNDTANLLALKFWEVEVGGQ